MRQFYFPSGHLNAHLNTRPPRFPTDPAKVPAWRHRMMLFLNSHGLGYTVKQSINPVNIISEDKTILARRHTPQVVAEHERAWTFLLEVTADAPFEETMLAAQTLEQAWHVIVGWGLPTSDAENALLVRQLETVQMELGEDPKIYFARVDKLLNTLKSVGIVKEEREIVRIIIRNLSDEYMVEKRSYPLTMPNISRFEVEETVRASYANRKYSDLGKLSVAVPAKAPPQVVINDPHALAVGGGLRGGGSGGQRQSRGGPIGGRRGQQQGGRGQQQQWSQGWNGQLPSHVDGQTRQQPFQQQYVHRQQQQHRYVHRQQQPQRYVHRQLQQQHQPHQQQYVRQQQQLLQPHRSSHHASPKWGIGGPFDCGSNATGCYQEESLPPPNTPMGGVYQCKRCGRLGRMVQICTTPQRFEGTCNSCGQYGHRHHNCITNTYHNTHAHANIISYPSGFNWGGSGTMPWPQQDPQQQQPEQQLISYDSDGGWVRGGIDCGAGVPPTSGNGGDGGVQQRYIGGHGSSDGSGGGNSSGGNGDNGDNGVDTGGGDDSHTTLVAGGSDPPPNWVVAEQQDGRKTMRKMTVGR